MELKEITKEDLPILAGIWKDTFSPPPWNDPWTDETALGRLGIQLDNPHTYGFLAYWEGKPAGFCLGHYTYTSRSKAYFMEDLCLLPDYQGKGIGKALMMRLKEELKAQGISIAITTTARSLPAFEFYQHLGFQHNPETTGLFWRL